MTVPTATCSAAKQIQAEIISARFESSGFENALEHDDHIFGNLVFASSRIDSFQPPDGHRREDLAHPFEKFEILEDGLALATAVVNARETFLRGDLEEQYDVGSNFSDVLNFPGTYIDHGDYVENEGYVLTSTDDEFVLELGFRYED